MTRLDGYASDLAQEESRIERGDPLYDVAGGRLAMRRLDHGPTLRPRRPPRARREDYP
jgi:hypothetical protein